MVIEKTDLFKLNEFLFLSFLIKFIKIKNNEFGTSIIFVSPNFFP